MKALVTGGGGFLGSAIVRQLIARGDEVRSFGRGDYPELRELGVEVIRGDLRDPDAVAAACLECDVVFHVAAKPPPWGLRADYQAINVGGTESVLAACRAAGVSHLVYTSTPSVVASADDAEGLDEGAPYAEHFLSDYAESKALAERRVLEANCEALQTVALRPHLIWGPGDPHFLPRFVAKFRAGQLRRIGDGDPLVDTVYVDNAAEAHLLAADRLQEGADIGGSSFFITNGEPVGLWSMVDRLLAVAGEGPVEGRVPVPVARLVAWLLEGIHRLFRLRTEPRLTRFVVEEVTRAHWFDISAARQKLGYQPRVSTDQGLALLREWWSGESRSVAPLASVQGPAPLSSTPTRMTNPGEQGPEA